MQTHDYAVWMAGGSLLLVAPDVPPAQRQAVLDTLLYSQLVANKAIGAPFTRYPHWYSRYRRALSERGWILTQLFEDTQSAHGSSMLAPIQPVSLWLETRYTSAANRIEQGLVVLKRTRSGHDSFRRFTFEGDETGTRVALEVGLVRPGPVIDLCSIALQTSQPLDQVDIGQPIPANALLGEIVVKGVSAQLDGDLFEPRREALRALIERKQQAQCYLLDLGKAQGDERG